MRLRKIVVLIPAHQEEGSITATIESMLAQTMVPDQIIVILNNCPDNTPAEAQAAAEGHPEVIVIEALNNKHRKASALNLAWRTYCQDAWMVIGVDGDTVLPPNAVADWAAEMDADPELGGSSSKFTMEGPGMLTRLQRAEFSRWSATSIRRGETSVLAGTGCAVRGDALTAVAARQDREGPWVYTSAVEDFEMTYRIRQLGYYCHVSATVPAYTDSMKTVKALWGQRMKWQVGTCQDLLKFGINKLTMRDWCQQVMGVFAALLRVTWIVLWIVEGALGLLRPTWLWVAIPGCFIAAEVAHSFKIPGRDWKDVVMSGLLVPNEIFAYLRAGWFLTAWFQVLIVRKERDRWGAQYAAETKAVA